MNMINYQLIINEEEKKALMTALDRVHTKGLNEANSLVHLARKVEAAEPMAPEPAPPEPPNEE